MHAEDANISLFNLPPVKGTYIAIPPDVLDGDHERFFSRTQPNEVTGCLDWMGGKSTNGYGVAQIGKKDILAHRAAYLLAHGDIPVEMCVLHTCDRRGCVNPAHLFLGTKKENTQDMLNKGRHHTGYTPRRKVTDAERELIWSMKLDGHSYYAIGKRLRRSQQHIKTIFQSLHAKRIN